MIEQKLGGKESVKIFLKGNQDLLDSLLSIEEGGSKLSRGFRALVEDKYGGRFKIELIREPTGDSASLLGEIEAALERAPHTGGGVTRLIEASPDLVVLSLNADIAGHGAGPPTVDSKKYTENMLRVIQLVKEHVGAHLIFLNASTVDPTTVISNYSTVDHDPPSSRAHKLDLALMEMSFLEGISIIDVDRLMAELGAAEHVAGPLDYSPKACEVVCGEFLRVVEDYGFFEERPLMLQVGQKGKSG